MSDWQPIETAPKDGSWFLICRACDGESSYEVGSYLPLTHPGYEKVEGGLYRKVETVLYEWTGFNNPHLATHWMPLPAPPKVTP